MPILGIIASSLPAAAGDFESIATVTVGSGGAATMAFSSIPGTYTDLLVKVSARTNQSDWNDNSIVRFNGDTGNNYSNRRLNGSVNACAMISQEGFLSGCKEII